MLSLTKTRSKAVVINRRSTLAYRLKTDAVIIKQSAFNYDEWMVVGFEQLFGAKIGTFKKSELSKIILKTNC